MPRALIVKPSHSRPGYTTPYEEALRAAGVEPVVVAPNAASLDGFQGLLLIGGTDVNPARYRQQPHAETDAPDDARDAAECALAGEALAVDLPLLAICRGMQILNVQHGGTLVQHLEGERHRPDEKDYSVPVHSVAIAPGSRLARIADGQARWDVNSRHHQAVDRVGDGLIVSARDPVDGVIEALERPDRRFVIAVQWHPENQSPVRKDQARLFQAFADAMA